MSTKEIKVDEKKSKKTAVINPEIQFEPDPQKQIADNLMEISATLEMMRKTMLDGPNKIIKAMEVNTTAVKAHVDHLANVLSGFERFFESTGYQHTRVNITDVLERIAITLKKENK